jgi:hypothetical protein
VATTDAAREGSRMPESGWRQAGALAVGIVMGAVLVRVIYGPAEEGHPVQAPSAEQQELCRDLSERMDRLDGAIRMLSDSIECLSVRPAQVVREIAPSDAPGDEAERATEGEPLIQERSPLASNAGWVEYLPRPLAEVLVAHGMTPFDRGVDRVLPGPVGKYKEADRARGSGIADLRKSYPDVRSTASERYPELKTLEDGIHGTWRNTTASIVAEFEAEVKKLALQRQGK